ncbi:MAG: tyrosine--tRNA ligase [Eubacteriaceae bacterium]|jgi:tyrosyl-tRNA synthetase|nr:tyrosine--tRNA ligase [Eubacteriaceae bacterium]
MSVFDVLKERGYIEQCTHEDEIRQILEREKVTFYIGFDPTADSLHVGHFIQIMVMVHMQKAGHIPIALLGGGTTMVGDPSGRTDMRQMLTKETISQNALKFKRIFERFLDFSEGKAIIADNAEWLLDLNYIDFLREIGPFFSVNRMISADAYKNRMETGLTFLEFNYMIMQAYDYYELYKRHGCKMQLGGNDQWSNIIAGVQLVRRKAGADVFGMTFALLVNSEGNKMGKTAKGALWLDPEKTSPYEFFQYWRNVGDSDVEKCLALLTFLPMDEVRRLGSFHGEEVNAAKETLAYEVTSLIHGREAADSALSASRSIFGEGGDAAEMPAASVPYGILGSDAASFVALAGLAATRSEARRLIEQGGIRINSEKISNPQRPVTERDFPEGALILQKGKKIYRKVTLQ